MSPRQNGNPILKSITAVPWEYSDIPADYVLGQTTCALFLSLKYHRLHPEYIYARIRGLAGKYQLRVILAMVDIENHEEPIKELTKTSIINNVTVILCWSAQEAGRYLELYKSFEGAAPTSIRAHQSTTYSDKLVDFITEPRGINKPDAVSLISVFGSLQRAVNAPPEEVATVPGWGEKKVQRWCTTVREPFRVKRAAARRNQDAATASRPAPVDARDEQAAVRMGIASTVPLGMVPAVTTGATTAPLVSGGTGPDEDEEIAMMEAVSGPLNPSKAGPSQAAKAAPREASNGSISQPNGTKQGAVQKKVREEYQPSEGVAAALSKLRRG